jgi:hypothetical protein
MENWDMGQFPEPLMEGNSLSMVDGHSLAQSCFFRVEGNPESLCLQKLKQAQMKGVPQAN